MGKVPVVEVEMDANRRLWVTPDLRPGRDLEFVYRAGREVRWSSDRGALTTPAPVTGTDFDRFTHIAEAVAGEYGELLFLTERTRFKNVASSFVAQIRRWSPLGPPWPELPVYRFQLRVDEPQGQRFTVGLELLREGELIVLCGMGVRLVESELEIQVRSTGPASITEATARRDLAFAVRTLSWVEKISPSFRALAADRVRRYLLIDDYHTGAIGLGEFRGRELRWYPSFSSDSE